MKNERSKLEIIMMLVKKLDYINFCEKTAENIEDADVLLVVSHIIIQEKNLFGELFSLMLKLDPDLKMGLNKGDDEVAGLLKQNIE